MVKCNGLRSVLPFPEYFTLVKDGLLFFFSAESIGLLSSSCVKLFLFSSIVPASKAKRVNADWAT